jgi:transposase-like protein
MKNQKKGPCPKNQYQKVSYDLKLSIIHQIANGQISANHASKVYNVSRSSIDYWMRKMLSFEQKNKAMAKKDEIKKLKERIEELELVKDIQQEVMAEVELEYGIDIAKKLLPGALGNQVEKKKKALIKQGFSANASESQDKPSTKKSEPGKPKNNRK